jgi:DNA repair exonuclease SbcCD ATPase subunit
LEFKKILNILKEINGNEEKLQKERKTVQDFEKKYKALKDKLRSVKENTNEDSDDLDKIESILKEAEEQILPQLNMMKGKILEMNNTPEENKNEEIQKQDVIVQDLQNNQEVIKQRGKELQDIHQISNEIKDISDSMVNKINEQGAILDDIEGNVVEAENNAKKGKQEITKADEMSRGNRKRMICFIVIISLSILAITGIILSIIFH